MRRTDILSFLNGLDKFKIIKDEHETEYVVFKDSKVKYLRKILDKTAFEAVENHIHLLDDITLKEFKALFPIAKSLGNLLLCCLKQSFPNKNFIVFVTLCVHDSFIIRFHQKWEDELPYYNLNDFENQGEKVFMFE